MELANNPTIPPTQTYARLVFLAVVSVVMACSMIMSVLTPFPLSMAILLYGRKLGISMGALCLVAIFILFFLVFRNGIGPYILTIYGFSFLSSILITEVFKRDIHPIKGLLKLGSSVVVFLCLLTVISVKILPKPLVEIVYDNAEIVAAQLQEQKKTLKKSPGSIKELQQLDFYSKPHLLTEKIMEGLPMVPSVLFIGVFFIIWLTMYLLLKSNEMYHFLSGYRYGEKDFLNFKVPDFVVWPVIGLLGLLLIDQNTIGEQVHTMAISLLRCLGVFYFFQGFGVYVAFLDFLKIGGFVRSFLVMFTVFTGSWILAAVGLFDMWVNFRKFFKPKENNDEL